jgi:hypothetical protein
VRFLDLFADGVGLAYLLARLRDQGCGVLAGAWELLLGAISDKPLLTGAKHRTF